MVGGFDIQNVETVLRNINSLKGFREQKQLMHKAGRKALKDYVTTAQKNVPKSGKPSKRGKLSLQRSIGVKTSRRSGTTVAGARRGGKFSGYGAHWFEKGTSERFTESSKASRGRVEATRPFGKAWQSTKQSVFTTYVNEIEKNLDNYINKALRR